MAPTSIPDGVGWTAISTASQRALESTSSAPRFIDPLAEALMQSLPEGTRSQLTAYEEKEREGSLTLLAGYVTVRTDYLDRQLLDCARAGIDQVVVLGSGLDGRAYRLAWPEGTRLWELDAGDVMQYKREVASHAGLTTRARVTGVETDLAGDWGSALRRGEFDPDRRVIWLVEGVLNYLSTAAAEALLATISALSVTDSRLIGNYLDEAAESKLAMTAADSDDESAERFASLRAAGPPAAPQEWLAPHGWEPEVVTVASWAREINRDAPPALDREQGGGDCWLFTAVRR